MTTANNELHVVFGTGPVRLAVALNPASGKVGPNLPLI